MCWIYIFVENRQIGSFLPKIAKLAIFSGNCQKSPNWRFFAKNRLIAAFRRKSPNWRFFLEIAKSDLFTKNRQIGAFSPKIAKLAIFSGNCQIGDFFWKLPNQIFSPEISPNWRFFEKNHQIGSFCKKKLPKNAEIRQISRRIKKTLFEMKSNVQ